MSAIKIDWNSLFDSHFEKLKKSFEKDHPELSYERSHPSEAAYAELHQSLPVPVRVMGIRLKPSPLHNLEGELCYLVSFVLRQLGDSGVEYLGEKSCSFSDFKNILWTKFGSRVFESFHPTPEFPINQFSDWDSEKRWFTMFLPFDIVQDSEELYKEMWLSFRSSIWTDLSEYLTFKIDFNQEFDLKPDPIIPKRMLLKAARPGAERYDFWNPEKEFERLTLNSLQEDVQAIQLIQSVPKGTREILGTAKRLYIFAYFNEAFYQVAEHYATLALESALKSRYWDEVKQPITLTDRYGQTRTLNRVDYHHVFQLCIGDSRWNLRKVKINGEPFLHSQKQLLDFMEKRKLLTNWEREMCFLLLSVRNSRSHPSSISNMPSNRDWLEMSARFINTLYIELTRKQELLDKHHRQTGLKS